MKRILYLILVLMMSVSMAGLLAACGDQEDETSESTAESTEATTEAATTETSGGIVLVKTQTDNYYGTWTAESGKAEYLYGTLEFTINDDNTWEGDVNYEKLHGTWEETDLGIHLDDVVLDWKAELNYTEKGKFVLTEDDLGVGSRIVLTKKEK